MKGIRSRILLWSAAFIFGSHAGKVVFSYWYPGTNTHPELVALSIIVATSSLLVGILEDIKDTLDDIKNKL